jgi:hypothetical protein
MALQVDCQTTSKSIERIKYVKINGDTFIQMSLEDAKVILKGVLDSEIADSLINIYTFRDSVNSGIISMQIEEIRLLQEKSSNQQMLSNNLNEMLKNKNSEVDVLNKIIADQKKEIRKQKVIKTLALIGDVALPVITLFVILGLK